ncbi:MAG: asparaginase [Alphaproteobacteria bacterium]|nr:asparaginase [Alphaproteobacteria bacterium]
MNAMPLTAAANRGAAIAAPVLVEVTRGGMVESRHAGTVAVVDAKGKTVLACGDIAQPVYPRSAIKPIQALPLIESGAAERYRLGDAEIALACASHGGEPRHVATVLTWLGRIGCTVDDLECGGHPPSHEASAEALYRGDGVVTPLHNNCSGKHTGFLSLAKHRGWPTRGYINEEHPVQQIVLRALAELGGADLARGARGIDGCGIPVVGMPIERLALAMARFADPGGLPDERVAAIKRIRAAMAKEPFMVAGTGRFCTRVMSTLGAAAMVKTGAEGVYMAALPTLGYGICLKIADGASRASQVALAAVLDRLGIEGARELAETPLKNVAGRPVGVVRPAGDLPF